MKSNSSTIKSFCYILEKVLVHTIMVNSLYIYVSLILNYQVNIVRNNKCVVNINIVFGDN